MPQYKNNEIRLENNSEIDNNLKAVEIGGVASPVYISKNAVKLFSNSTFIIGESLVIADDSTTQDVAFKGNMHINSSYFSDSITLAPNIDILAEMSIKIKEKAAANDDTAGYGQLWIKTASPNELYFTNDAGNDIQLTSGSSVVGGGGSGDMTGVDLTGGTGIEIASEANTTSGDYSATINCNLEGIELKSTGITGTAKFLRVDGDGTCSWQTPSYIANTNTTYTGGTNLTLDGTTFNVADAFLINSGDDSTSGTLTADGFNSGGTWTFAGAAGGDVAIQEVHSGTSFSDDDTSLMTAGAIKEKIENYGYGTSNLALGTSGSTALAGNTALLQIGTSGSTAMAGNTAVGENNVSGDSGNSAIYDNSGTPTLKSGITQAEMQTAIGGVYTDTDTDVTVTNLEARLAEIDNGVTYIGATSNDDIQPRGEVRFAHAASFVEQPTDSFLISTHYISWDQGNKYNLTLQGANINFTSHPSGACNLLLKLTQPASGSTFTSITWTLDGSDTLLWPGGTNPTLSSANGAVDILSFYFDGTSKYYGVASLNFS